jgi:predicted metal-dependent hydrolase
MKTEIVRSPQRKATVSARIQGDTLIVRAPQDMSQDELEAIIQKLAARLENRRTRHQLNSSRALMDRAQELNKTYFKGQLQVASIEYVTNQERRFGSCSPHRRAIRISHRLASVPAWVRDYVIVHELAHLTYPNHGRRFWALVSRYPLAERARGYLMAMGMEPASDGSGQEPEETPADELEE